MSEATAIRGARIVQAPGRVIESGTIVIRNGVVVGSVRAASYGHTLGGAVGLAEVTGDPVNAAWLEEGDWEVEIAGKRYPAEVSLKPMFDPGMARIKA